MNYADKLFELQKIFQISFRGIRLNRVMIFEMYEFCKGGRIGVFNAFKRAFHTLSLAELNIGKEVLTTFGRQDRKDHFEVYTYVMSRITDKATVNDLRKVTIKKCFHPIDFIRLMIISVWKLRTVSFMSLKQKIELSLLVNYYTNAIYELDKLDLTSVKKYLSMYNATQMENLITQYMKLKGIKTFSLCEGIYVVEKTKNSIDNVNYLNIETENLLTWGKWVNDEFKKEGIIPERMTACGYPHPVKVSQMNSNSPMKKCMVLLARGSYHEANLKLLDILYKTTNKYRYDLKCHPVSDLAFYEDFANLHDMGFVPKSKTVNDCLNKDEYDFAIAVNTSAYYESLMRGVPCLRFTDDSFTLMLGYDDIFSNLDRYIDILEKIKNELPLGQYQKDVDFMLEYVMGVGIDNYRKVILG